MQTTRYAVQRSDSSPRATIRVQTPSSTNQARSSSTSKSKKKKLNASASRALSPQSPLRKSHAGVHATDGADTTAFTCEQVLFGQLVALKSILLKSTSSRTFHDFSLLQNHIENRAVAGVEEDLELIMDKLVQLRGPSQNHRITAYSQLLASLTNEVETAVFNVDRRTVTNLKNDQLAVKIQMEQHQTQWHEKIARKDQTILAMQAEHASMDFKNKSLVRTVELLSKELEKCNTSLSNVHQRSVELQMQAIDFKAEVDKRANRVLQSVQSRVGFVPESVQKQLNLLTSLMPPGDVNYDKVRMEIYRRHVANGGSAPGTPTSTSRKAATQHALQLQIPSQTVASPRSSFTSSSPTSTNISIPNTPPRSCHAPNTGNAAPPNVSSAKAPTTVPPPPSAPRVPEAGNGNTGAENSAADGTPAVHAAASSKIPASTSSRLSTSTPQTNEVQRRQMLITSLFPRSATVQDSTGIDGISFQPTYANLQAKSSATPMSGQLQHKSAPSSAPAPSTAHPLLPAHAPNHTHGTQLSQKTSSSGNAEASRRSRAIEAALQAINETSSDNDANQLQDQDGYESDEGDSDSSDGEGEDGEGGEEETRTNPSASPRSYSFYDNEEEADGELVDAAEYYRVNGPFVQGQGHGIAQVDVSGDVLADGDGNDSSSESSAVTSTSAGADDELARRQTHSAHTSHGAHTVSAASAHVQHNIPHVATHVKGDTRKGNAFNSESDEGNDFYQNMQKFIRGFQESQLIDVSDSEIDIDQRANAAQASRNVPGIAAAAKHRTTTSASKNTKAHHAGPSSGKAPSAATNTGRVVTLVSEAPPVHSKKTAKR